MGKNQYKTAKSLTDRIDTLFLEIDSDTCVELRNNRIYDDMAKETLKIQHDFPVVPKLTEFGASGIGAVSLSEEEHKALVRYLDIRYEMGRMEHKQIYTQGHRDCYDYFVKIIGIHID